MQRMQGNYRFEVDVVHCTALNLRAYGQDNL